MTGLAIASGVVMVVCLVLAALAWRGRRVGDHPHCRRCGFDVYGIELAAGKCPECGAALHGKHAVHLGTRRHRPVLAAVALALALLSGAGVGGGTYLALSGLDWLRVQPVWLLRRQAQSLSHASALVGIQELTRRLEHGELSPAQAHAVVRDALATQADRPKPWLRAWGEVVERAEHQQMLPRALWKQYAREAVRHCFTVEVRPRVRKGDPLPGRFVETPARVGQVVFWLRVRSEGLRIDGGTPLAVASTRSPDSDGYASVLVLDASQTPLIAPPESPWVQSLEPGVHTLAETLRVDVFDSRLANAAPVDSLLVQREARFEVLPEAQSSVTLEPATPDPAVVERSISVACFHVPVDAGAERHLGVHVLPTATLPPLAFRAVVRDRATGREWDVGHLVASDDERYGDARQVTGFNATRVDVLLFADPYAAAETVTVDRMWYDREPIVVEDVEVRGGK